MYVEWWMIGVMGIWWYLSVKSISNSSAKAAYAEGANTGIQSTLTVLEQMKIIRIDANTGEIVPLPPQAEAVASK
jgi:hypothetical protein